MRRSFVTPTTSMNRINVIPIIDVSLVLVVILLVTAPVLSVADIGIQLPQAATRGAEDDLRVSVTIGKNGELAVDESMVTPSGLESVIGSRIAETRQDVLVVVRADASIPYEAVAEVLRRSRNAGAKRLAIATRQGDEILDGGLVAPEANALGNEEDTR